MIQGHMYTAIFQAISASALQDLLELTAAAGVPVWVHEILITCRGGNDERLNLMVHRATTSGSGGGTVTPNPTSPASPAASTVVERNNTTQGTDGVILDTYEWDLRMPQQYLPVPAGKFLIPGGGRLSVSLETAPAAARVMSGKILFEEVK